MTMRLKFLLLIEALLKEGGEDIYSLSHSAFGRRFYVSRITIGKAFKDLEKFRG